MQHVSDPLLNEQSPITTDQENAVITGLYVVGIDNNRLDEYGALFNQVFENCSSTRNGLTMLQGAMFALASKENSNPEWKEQCASSLRELLHHWKGKTIAEDFRKLYPNSPKVSATEVYRRLMIYYGYFSGITHHEAAGIMGSMRSITNDQTLKLEDCYSDEVFIKAVKEFFGLINNLYEFTKLESANP